MVQAGEYEEHHWTIDLERTDEMRTLKAWGKEYIFEERSVALTQILRVLYRDSLYGPVLQDRDDTEVFQTIKDDMQSFVSDLLPRIGQAEGLPELVEYKVKDVSLWERKTLRYIIVYPQESSGQDESDKGSLSGNVKEGIRDTHDLEPVP